VPEGRGEGRGRGGGEGERSDDYFNYVLLQEAPTANHRENLYALEALQTCKHSAHAHAFELGHNVRRKLRRGCIVVCRDKIIENR
jgi:hypothetical protein